MADTTPNTPPGDAPSGGWLTPTDLDAIAERQSLPEDVAALRDPSRRPPLPEQDYLQSLHQQRASDRVTTAARLLSDFRIRGEEADALKLAAHVGGKALRGFAVVREADGRVALTRVDDGPGEVDWEGATPLVESVVDAIEGGAAQLARVRNQHLLRDGVERERSYRPNPQPLDSRYRPIVDGVHFDPPKFAVLDPAPLASPTLDEATEDVRAAALGAELELLAETFALDEDTKQQLVEAPFKALARELPQQALDETALVMWRVPGPGGESDPRLAIRVHRWAPFATEDPNVGPRPLLKPGQIGAQRIATFRELVEFAQKKAHLRWTAGDVPADTVLRLPLLRFAAGPGYRSEGQTLARPHVPVQLPPKRGR